MILKKINRRLLLFCLLIYTYSLAQFSLAKNIYRLDRYDNSINISEVIDRYNQGEFSSEFNLETYKNLKGKEAGWVMIDIPKLEKRSLISIENSLFESLNFYLYKDNVFQKKRNLKNVDYYRFPLIEIKPIETPAKVFIRFKDKLSYRTEFNLYSYDDRKFAKQQQRDYFFIGGYVISLFVLLVSTTILFLYKGVYAVLWYVIHLSLLILEYLISTGVFSQWILPNEWILKYGLDHVAMLLSTMALSEFFRNYYQYTAKTKFCKWVYLTISIACLLGVIYAIFDGFVGNIYNIEYYAQSVLNYASLLSLAIHFILVFSKVIPVYLFIAFLLPVLGIFANTGEFKNQFDTTITYFLFQSVYLGILIEVIVIVFYMIKQSVDKEFEAVALEEENSKLKNEFQEKISNNQEAQKNEIVNDVHDSFSGYLEALKLRLMTKEVLTPDIETILEAFRKDYRFLLNSLYVPNVNSDNLLSSIEDYCERMNTVTAVELKLEQKGGLDKGIPQATAKYIFKASSELTTNALKYANPTKVTIRLKFYLDKLILEIEDNGIGFNSEKIKSSSFGLRGLKERALAFGGSFVLNSFTGKGTSVKIELPLNRS